MSAQWFHDSVEAGYSMPEPDYDVDREQGGAGEGGENANGTSRKRYVNIGLYTVYNLFIHIVIRVSCKNFCLGVGRGVSMT